jgi:hypothetical protein
MTTVPQKTIAWVVLIAFTTACTGMHTIRQSETKSWQEQLELGDVAEVLRKDGSRASLTVEQIDDIGFSGGGIAVAFADIEELSVERPSVTMSVLLGVGILVGVVLIGLLSIDEDDFFPSFSE